MIYSKSGLHLTEQFESCRLQAYRPTPNDVPTVGYGHTRGVGIGLTCLQAQAEAWLIEDVAAASAAVNQLVKVPLTQGEFDAKVDFTFNLGVGNLSQSTMLKLLNGGDYAGAAGEFEKWDKQGGTVLAGLLHRRQVEEAEFRQV